MDKYSPDIIARRLKFHLPQDIPKYWHNNSEIETYHFNAIAIFLPILEKLVVQSLKKALQEVSSPKLKSEVASLIAQEAIHGSEFHRYNSKIVSKHYPISTQQYKMRSFRLFAGLVNRFSTTFHYALSAAGEHFTAITSDQFLRSSKWFLNVDPVYSAIWRWHCIEEIEHKSVAFDVFQSLNGRYLTRVLAMLLMTVTFSILYINPIWKMMKQDGNHKKWKYYIKAFQYYWGKEGLYRSLCKPYFDYFKPSFHPSHHNNHSLIEQWKEYFTVAPLLEIAESLQSTNPPLKDY